MNLDSPTAVLGGHADRVREELIEVIRTRHELTAEAHDVAETRFGFGFGGQWRDLLADTCEAFAKRGFETFKLFPAGYRVPIVNGCLVFVWRVPKCARVGDFASSQTRRNGFSAQVPDQLALTFGDDSVDGHDDTDAFSAPAATVREAASGSMPMVLVRIDSSPRLLQRISWAVAALDTVDRVQLLGNEVIWEPELIATPDDSVTESFDSGEPIPPVIEPRPQDDTGDE